MHRQPTFLLRSIGFTVFILAVAQTLPGAGEYTYTMFDGQSLQGWSVENNCRVAVKNGTMLLEAGDGWLRSHHTYSDFKLHVEWKALKEGQYDAGIYLRASNNGNPFPKKGYQVNLLQGKEGNVSNLAGATSSGLINPPGEWNTFDITAVGRTLTTIINGKKAYTAEGMDISRGYVGIQVEVPKGGQFQFRNIRITEIDYRSLFNGKDFAGWQGAGQPARTCWSVENNVIVGLKKKGPWLRSTETFADFNLRLEYQVAAGGNSGIYVRVPADGKHHRDLASDPPAGFEVQILDDSAPKHANLKDYQYSGSVYDIAGAHRHVSTLPGIWNTLELNCRNHHITSIHNGVVIVDADARRFPLLMLRQLKGHLGLQNHGGGVKFRKLRIGPPVE